MSEEGAPPKKKQGERNPGASLQQKLRNHARATGEDVALILIRFLNERFLYRLSVSPYRDQFVLRGATLFALWNTEPHRATRDIDLLAYGDSSPAVLREILLAVCKQEGAADGVTFLPETLQIEERTEGRVYQGLHIEMLTELGTARPRLEIDIAFGEAVTPPPQEVELPVLLGMPAPRLRAYERETAIAEKCEALVSLGLPNTRLKDFYDLWYLSRTFAFAGSVLQQSLHATFTRRGTVFPPAGLPRALTAEFSEDPLKQRQWQAFVGKTGLRQQAETLPQMIAVLRVFLQPPLAALAEGRAFEAYWTPEEGWRADSAMK